MERKRLSYVLVHWKTRDVKVTSSRANIRRLASLKPKMDTKLCFAISYLAVSTSFSHNHPLPHSDALSRIFLSRCVHLWPQWSGPAEGRQTRSKRADKLTPRGDIPGDPDNRCPLSFRLSVFPRWIPDPQGYRCR